MIIVTTTINHLFNCGANLLWRFWCQHPVHFCLLKLQNLCIGWQKKL